MAKKSSNRRFIKAGYPGNTFLSWIENPFRQGGDINIIAPSSLSISNDSIDEENVLNDVVGDFSSNGNGFKTYSLVSGSGDTDNSSFSIISNQLLAAEVFDYEVKNSYSIRVRVSNSEGQFEQSFTININDVVEGGTQDVENISTTESDGVFFMSYDWNGSGDESNIKPYIKSVYASGTQVEGNVLTIDVKYSNESIYSLSSANLRVYRSSDNKQSSESLVATLTSYSIVDYETIRFQYTSSEIDADDFLRFEANVTLDGGLNDTSDYYTSQYYFIEAIPSALDEFDVRKDHVDDAIYDGSNVVTAWNGQGVLGNPTYNETEDAIYFDRVNADGFQFSKPSLGSSWEVWLHIKFNETGVLQYVDAIAGANGVRINNNKIEFLGTDTGVFIQTTSYIVIRCHYEGASSFVQVNNGTKIPMTLSQTVGTADGFLGRQGSGNNSSHCYIKFHGIKSSAITDVNATAIYNELIGS